jgi:hypothetical protein
MKKYIGKLQIKETLDTLDKTPVGSDIVKVVYLDESVEFFSRPMYDKIVSEVKCDETELRDKRVRPVVEMCLAIVREWGLTVGELPYMSALINQSLQYNSDQALIKLLSKYMPKPKSLDSVDYLTIDRILKDDSSSK